MYFCVKTNLKVVIMTDKIKIDLGPVQKTLLIPLWGRAAEYEKKAPVISDKYAHDIVSRLDFDFQQMAGEMTNLVQVNCAIRAYHIDNELKKIIAEFPDATIVNIGAGLDTTFHRVDNGRIHWYDLDVPDSMTLRKQLIPESARNKYIVASAFDKDWYSQVTECGSKVVFIAAGVLVYFREEQVKGLLLSLADAFPGSDMIFETYSQKMLEYRNKAIRQREKKSDLQQDMHWGVKSGKVIARWSTKIKLVEQYGFYSRVPVTDENKKVIRQFFLVNLFGWFRIVHLRLG